MLKKIIYILLVGTYFQSGCTNQKDMSYWSERCKGIENPVVKNVGMAEEIVTSVCLGNHRNPNDYNIQIEKGDGYFLFSYNSKLSHFLSGKME
jgi:hypothetical protein